MNCGAVSDDNVGIIKILGFRYCIKHPVLCLWMAQRRYDTSRTICIYSKGPAFCCNTFIYYVLFCEWLSTVKIIAKESVDTMRVPYIVAYSVLCLWLPQAR